MAPTQSMPAILPLGYRDDAREKATESVEQIPTLNPVAIAPIGCRRGPEAVEFLRRIGHIEILDTETVDGVTYYCIDVYFEAVTTRIPTIARRKDTLHLSSRRREGRTSVPGQSRLKTGNDLTPDTRVRRRFSDFEDLRALLIDLVEAESRSRCHHCNAWMTYFSFNAAQPGWLSKLVRSKTWRRQVLVQFLKNIIRLAVLADGAARWQERHDTTLLACRTPELTAPLVKEFLWSDEDWQLHRQAAFPTVPDHRMRRTRRASL